MFAYLNSLFRNLFQREWKAQDLDEEIRSHLELLSDEKIRGGMNLRDAAREARIELGGVEQVKERVRAVRAGALLETFWQDVHFGTRLLRKSPGFTAVAVVTLALGIGANTTIFSVAYAVLLQQLPYKDPSRLVVLNETTPKVGIVSVSYPNFLDWRADSQAFSQMAALSSVDFNLAGGTVPEHVSGEAVSTNFFSMMGIRPFLGRGFDVSEEAVGTPPVILLSYSMWQSHFGADPGAISKTITLDGHVFTIVGILPPNFRSSDKTDVMLPIGVWATNNSEAAERSDRGDMIVIGRLAPGITFAQARSEMENVAARLAKEYPTSNAQFGVALQPIRNTFVGDLRLPIFVLYGAAMFVLLIACANLANLLLVRGEGRAKEVALRTAFGASRSRLICQMLTESFMLAFLGGILGLAVAIGGIRVMARMIPTYMLSGATVGLNGEVLLLTAGVVVLAAFIFGLMPAFHSTRPDIQQKLKAGGRTTSMGANRNRLRGVLVIAETSFALILLVGAGLMIKSLYRLLEVDPGFRPDRVLMMVMDLTAQQYSQDAAVRTFWQQVLDRVGPLPGVESAAVGTVVPLAGSHDRQDITIEGMTLPGPGNYPHPDIHIISSGYVTTLGISLLRGRTFTDSDNERGPLVGMINAMMARRLFPDQDPIGKRFKFGREYVPVQQDPTSTMALVVKSKADPAALTSGIRNVMQSIDKDQPIFAVSTMKQLVSNSVATRRITLVLLALFGGLAITLAAIGIYGVISYSVAQRLHEIGVRMALGAPQGNVLRLVIGQGMKLAGSGITIGIVAAFGFARLMSSLLYGVSATDFETLAEVVILLAVVALVACCIPARRAIKVDPMAALRHE